VTPYIVKPIDDPATVALPTDAVIGKAGRAAEERDTAAAGGPTTISPAPGLAGAGGFVVE